MRSPDEPLKIIEDAATSAQLQYPGGIGNWLLTVRQGTFPANQFARAVGLILAGSGQSLSTLDAIFRPISPNKGSVELVGDITRQCIAHNCAQAAATGAQQVPQVSGDVHSVLRLNLGPPAKKAPTQNPSTSGGVVSPQGASVPSGGARGTWRGKKVKP